MFLDNTLLINQKKFETIEKDLTCPICQGILNDPYFCNKCQNNFCANCISKYKINNNKCPFRCKNPEYVNNKFLKKIFNELLKFKCGKDCDEIIPYKDVNKHYKNCYKEDFKEKYLECATKVEILKVQIENYDDIKNQLDEAKERNEELLNELDEIRESKNELENELEELKGMKNDYDYDPDELRDLKDQLYDKNQEIENLLYQINKLNEEKKDLQNEINNLKNKNLENELLNDLKKKVNILKKDIINKHSKKKND